MRICLTICVLGVFIAACGGNENILRSGKETPPQASAPRDTFTEDLAAMKTAGFTSIYVLRRKDGGKIDSEDRGVIRVNTTDANRRVSSDEDRAFVIGTNYPIPPANITALYARFAVEDHSPPPVVTQSNTNTAPAK